jgi:multidrug resistance efflux pump
VTDGQLQLERSKGADLAVGSAAPPARAEHKRRFRILPILTTLAVTAIAAALGWAMWVAYMETPWTRDATVRTYVVTMAPEIAGRIVELPVIDNQFVRTGDLLVVIEKTDYKNSLDLAEAGIALAQATASNARREADRRRALPDIAETVEDRQNYEAAAAAADARRQQAIVTRDQAKVNLDRTEIRSPVNGWVTNLVARVGDYATVGRNIVSVVDADTFWIDAYFEETQLASIHEGDPATIKLLGQSALISGEVVGISRGINVANALADPMGLATVNPIFTWVRLAQRIPVRIQLNHVPDNIRLVAGLTATVQVDPRPGPPRRAILQN